MASHDGCHRSICLASYFTCARKSVPRMGWMGSGIYGGCANGGSLAVS